MRQDMFDKLLIAAGAASALLLSGQVSSGELKVDDAAMNSIEKVMAYCTSNLMFNVRTEDLFTESPDVKKIVEEAITYRFIKEWDTVQRCPSENGEELSLTACFTNFDINSTLMNVFGKSLSFDKVESYTSNWLSYNAKDKIWTYPVSEFDATPGFVIESAVPAANSTDIVVNGHLDYQCEMDETENHPNQGAECTAVLTPNKLKNNPGGYALVSLKCDVREEDDDDSGNSGNKE